MERRAVPERWEQEYVKEDNEAVQSKCLETNQGHDGFAFFPILGLGFTLFPPPSPPPSSPSSLTVLRLRLLLTCGLVFALAALLFVPCWLRWGTIDGATI